MRALDRSTGLATGLTDPLSHPGEARPGLGGVGRPQDGPGGVSLELADIPTDTTDAIIELEMPHAPQ